MIVDDGQVYSIAPALGWTKQASAGNRTVLHILINHSLPGGHNISLLFIIKYCCIYLSIYAILPLR